MTTLNYIDTKDKQGYIGAEELQAFLANKPEIISVVVQNSYNL